MFDENVLELSGFEVGDGTASGFGRFCGCDDFAFFIENLDVEGA